MAEQEKKTGAAKGGAKGGAKGATNAPSTTVVKAPEQKQEDKKDDAPKTGSDQTQTPPVQTGDQSGAATVSTEEKTKVEQEEKKGADETKEQETTKSDNSAKLEEELEKTKQENKDLKQQLKNASKGVVLNTGSLNKPSFRPQINPGDMVLAKHKKTGEKQRFSKTTFEFIKNDWELTAEEPDEVKNLKKS